MTTRVFYYKYLDNSQKLKTIIRPHQSSRYTQYYTEHLPGFDTNVIRCFVEPPRKCWSAEVKLVDITLHDAKEISISLNMPLVVVLKQYCNIDEVNLEISDIFYWMHREEN